MKKSFTGKDAAILAFYAQYDYCLFPKEEVLSLMKDLSCDEARLLAQAILDKDRSNLEVKEYLDWADNLYLHSS